jgi:hypothetical protein
MHGYALALRRCLKFRAAPPLARGVSSSTLGGQAQLQPVPAPQPEDGDIRTDWRCVLI